MSGVTTARLVTVWRAVDAIEAAAAAPDEGAMFSALATLAVEVERVEHLLQQHLASTTRAVDLRVQLVANDTTMTRVRQQLDLAAKRGDKSAEAAAIGWLAELRAERMALLSDLRETLPRSPQQIRCDIATVGAVASDLGTDRETRRKLADLYEELAAAY